MLTWTSRVVFKFNENLELLDTLPLPDEISQGWGMTHFTDKDNNVRIVVSDGTERIFHINPEDFTVVKTLQIKDSRGLPID